MSCGQQVNAETGRSSGDAGLVRVAEGNSFSVRLYIHLFLWWRGRRIPTRPSAPVQERGKLAEGHALSLYRAPPGKPSGPVAIVFAGHLTTQE